MKIWWFYSDKIFPNYGPDEKFRCQIRQYSIPPKLDHGRPFPHLYQEGTGVVTEGGIRAMPLVQAKEVFC
ncbi:hypothetical protein HanRHA438_Chr16g0736251 [Helianthus annuus]|nr:hypothetical protein HanIR_Chr13g0666771 [Helianthus annuus]KAJ0833760.1 hypothetical protein HanRHA438_Chr16g0736251 [Helianthus annuus]